VPQVQRSEPMWRQVASHYKGMILRGELREGDQLPSVRQIRDEWGVSQGVAQRAVEHLHLAERLVATGPSGTVVAAPRAAFGPQQRMRLTAAPASEVVTVTSAGLVPAPAYVVPLLGLAEGDPVIRREEVTRRADGSPHRLSVTWCAPQYSLPVPELTAEEPLPDPRGAGPLIAQRLEVEAGNLHGGVAFEARLAKDDGRELPALGLAAGAFVLAGVSGWRYGDDTLEYTEFVLPAGQVVEADIEP
jgi:GntR family transcriptional regulator